MKRTKYLGDGMQIFPIVMINIQRMMNYSLTDFHILLSSTSNTSYLCSQPHVLLQGYFRNPKDLSSDLWAFPISVLT